MPAEKTTKPKLGRPVVVGEGAVVTNVRLSKEQDALVLKASKKAGKRKSEWMRVTLFEQAAQQAA
ncbi:MAG TPA: hypothetical protein VN048_04945 [Verrucomicrobiae bacterium]|jgi:hypothetical protein|nr:hypothetical protein [Verrucomicrobiae bacterium]